MVTSQKNYYYGTGKRKSAVAKVRLYPNGAGIVVNGKPLEEAFPWEPWRTQIVEPLKVSNLEGQVLVQAKVGGGGVRGQAGALRHGISRALLAASPDLKDVLRKQGLLTRDARVKERRKYGYVGARKTHQSPKR